MNYYLSVLKNYATFTGRARRSEYWYFTLFNFIFVMIAMVLDSVLGLSFGGAPYGGGPIYLIYGLATLIPTLAVSVRRLHDVGKSGWFYLIFLTCIGIIWLLVLYCTDSNPGANKYGPNPKGVDGGVPA